MVTASHLSALAAPCEHGVLSKVRGGVIKPTVISLFSGAGGLDYGLEAAGFAPALCVDLNPDACATVRASRPWEVVEEDVTRRPPAEILSMAGLQVADADLLAAGPPCQPFSQAGLWARGGTARIDDPRAETLIAFMRAWRAILPRAVLMESVPGLVHGGTDVIDYIGREISAINREHGTHYELLWTVLNSADYGVPQLRRRFVLVSSREGRPFEFPEPTHHDGGQLQFGAAGAVPHRTAWDAIGDLKPPADGLEPTGRWAELLRSIPEGENYLFHTERGGGEPLFGWRRRYWSFLLKLAKSRPSWTIPAEPGSATGPFHWNSRRLSTRELCRLQTIPDDVEIVGSYRSAHRQIGNAVPSLLAEVLGRAIRRQLFDDAGLDRKLILLPPDRSPPPPAEQPTPVPNHYLAAGSSDTPHPGTGLGRAALERRRATLAPPAASQSVSAVMRGNRSTDTRPERLLRSDAASQGLPLQKVISHRLRRRQRSRRHRFPEAPPGRVRGRLLLAPVPVARQCSARELYLLGNETCPQCRAGQASESRARGQWLASRADLGTRSVRGRRRPGDARTRGRPGCLESPWAPRGRDPPLAARGRRSR